MKKWQAVLLNIGFVFASIFIPKIPNADLQKAVTISVASIAAAAAKKNSETDDDGQKIVN
jgi:hypothetical protein